MATKIYALDTQLVNPRAVVALDYISYTPPEAGCSVLHRKPGGTREVDNFIPWRDENGRPNIVCIDESGEKGGGTIYLVKQDKVKSGIKEPLKPTGELNVGGMVKFENGKSDIYFAPGYFEAMEELKSTGKEK